MRSDGVGGILDRVGVSHSGVWCQPGGRCRGGDVQDFNHFVILSRALAVAFGLCCEEIGDR